MCTRHSISERLSTYSWFQPGSVKFILLDASTPVYVPLNSCLKWESPPPYLNDNGVILEMLYSRRSNLNFCSCISQKQKATWYNCTIINLAQIKEISHISTLTYCYQRLQRTISEGTRQNFIIQICTIILFFLFFKTLHGKVILHNL